MRNPGTGVIESGEHLHVYANRNLWPAEVVLLVRYRTALSGRVLEVGCGAGRVLGYLTELGGEVHGVDISQRMVDYCRRRYPEAHVRVGDMCTLPTTVTGPFDVVYASANVIDVLDDEERRHVISDMRTLLAPSGLLVFSSHNLANIVHRQQRRTRGIRSELLSKLNRPPTDLVRAAVHLPKRRRNRRRLRPLERHEDGYAIVNDDVHENSLLLYYVTREHQARQLAELGFDLLECLDAEGRPVEDGDADGSFDLHYVAVSSSTPSP